MHLFMEVINGIQIEVNQIIIKVCSLIDKRSVNKFKRLIFLSDISSICQENYLVKANYYECAAILTKQGEWIKCDNDYNELKKVLINWFEDAIEDSTTSAAV